MPTLIRLFIVLLVLAALTLGGMLALAVFVQPGQKEIRVKVSTGVPGTEQSSDPLGIRALPEPTALPRPAATADEPPPAAPGTRDVDVDIPE